MPDFRMLGHHRLLDDLSDNRLGAQERAFGGWLGTDWRQVNAIDNSF